MMERRHNTASYRRTGKNTSRRRSGTPYRNHLYIRDAGHKRMCEALAKEKRFHLIQQMQLFIM